MNYEIKEILKDILFDETVKGFICTDECYEELKNYITNLQQRIDKTIEYCDKEIRNIIANFDYIDTKDLENVRKILKGESDD